MLGTYPKVAWIRNDAPQGQSAAGRLNCPCGNAPESEYAPGPNVICGCGRVFSWNGWLKEGKPIYHFEVGQARLRHKWEGENAALLVEMRAALASEWKPYSELERIAPFVFWDTAWQYGLIDCRIEHLERDGLTCGSVHYYRLRGAQ